MVPSPKNTPLFDLAGSRVLVYIVAYNAEKTISHVLNRIPESLRQPEVEVLVIDDSSADGTFSAGSQTKVHGLQLTVLRNPVNQGYGGNQKLGYRYAIEHGFDIVALVHGDGQYAPEKLPELLQPLLDGEADAVFGSRMLVPGAARSGGMPAYKFIGNRVLSCAQNWLLRGSLSEFHSGYRVYTVNALRQIPFERNTRDFHFDTEIIAQLLLKNLRIAEVAIPTYYGDEICHVNGLKYAWNVIRTSVRVRLHQLNLLYDRKFEVGRIEEKYTLKLGYHSSHTDALAAVREGAQVLDLGCGEGYWAEEAGRLGAEVTALDQFAPIGSSSAHGVRYLRANLDEPTLPTSPSEYDQIFMLDIIEHLKDPEQFLENLREATGRKRPELILTTANIGFVVTRLMLTFGQFNYGRKGILDRTHTRLFTFKTLRHALEEAGYEVQSMHGVPAPIPAALGGNLLSRCLMAINRALIHVCRGLFSYQIFVKARATPTIQNLLGETIDASAKLAAALDTIASRETRTQ
ncbi:MAG TPA: bifunctional glycosyltransferase/class I SAM-dependent methyltransferase [Chthoniobacterales bacterium]